MLISRKKYIYYLILFFILFSFLLLIGPKVAHDMQERECVVNINLPSIFGLSLNCDSPEFMRLARDPKGLLEEKNIRQARPGMIFVANIISFPLKPLNMIAGLADPEAGREAPERIGNMSQYFSVFSSYALINFIFIILAWLLMFFLWDREKQGKVSLLMLPVAALVISNDVFKMFFWSPHTQIFNIFVPILCAWTAIWAWRKNLLYSKYVYLVSFLVGLGITAYATFVLFLPSLLIPAFFKKRDLKSFILRSVIVILLAFLPLVAWMMFVYFKVGSFYNHEIEVYRQIVWVFEQNIFATIALLAKNFFLVLKEFIVSNFIILLVTFFASFFVYKKINKEEKETVIILALISLMFGLFFSLVGLHVPRISFTMLPPIYIMLGMFLEKIWQKTKSKAFIFLVFFLFFAWSLYTLLKYISNNSF